jgi:hypothetical protein
LFDREVAFVCGTSLARSDVSAFLTDNCLRVVYDNTALVDDGNSLVSKAKDALGPGADKLRFFKAKIVHLGTQIGECLVRTPVSYQFIRNAEYLLTQTILRLKKTT